MSTSRRSSSRASTAQNNLISKRLSAALILAFVGIPSLGFVIVTGVFNAIYAAQMGHNHTVWVAGSVLVTAFAAGLPLATEFLRSNHRNLVTITQSLWVSTLLFSFLAASSYAIRTPDNNPLKIELSNLQGRVLPEHRPTSEIRDEIHIIQTEIGVNCGRWWLPLSRQAREACEPVYELERELADSDDAERTESHIKQLQEQLDVPEGSLDTIGSSILAVSTWKKLLTIFVASLIELAAAMGLTVTARTILDILHEEEGVQEQSSPTETIEPSALPEIDPDTGWAMWFQSCVSAQPGGRVTVRNAFEHYISWAALNNITSHLHYTVFGKRMSNNIVSIGGQLKHSNGHYYNNISLAVLGSNGNAVTEELISA